MAIRLLIRKLALYGSVNDEKGGNAPPGLPYAVEAAPVPEPGQLTVLAAPAEDRQSRHSC